MKILHLTTHIQGGGITIYIFQLTQPLRELGVENFVVSSGGDYSKDFNSLQVKTLDLSIRTKNEYHPKIYWPILGFIKTIREEKVDLIHAHTRIAQVMASWVQRIAKVPFISTAHGFYQRRVGRYINPAWGRKVIAISHPVAQDLIQTHKLSEDKIRVVENGIDFEGFQKRFASWDAAERKKAYGFQPGDPVVGTISRLVEPKGLAYLIKAIKILKRDYPNVKGLLVGEGKDRSILEKLVKQEGLQGEVIFTGNIPDVTEALVAMDYFTLTPVAKEGFGLSLLEAIACRKPLVVSDVDALNSLIQDGVKGFVVPPADEKQLAEALKELLENEAKAGEMSANAFEWARKDFGIERMASQIKSVYEEVLGSS